MKALGCVIFICTISIFSTSASANSDRVRAAQEFCLSTLKSLANNENSWLGWKVLDINKGEHLSSGVNFFGYEVPLLPVEKAYIELFQLKEPEIIFNNNFKYIQVLSVIKPESMRIGVSGAGIEKQERAFDLIKESYSYSPESLDCHSLSEKTTPEEYQQFLRVATLLILKAASAPQSSQFVIDVGADKGFITVLDYGFIHQWENKTNQFSYTFVLGKDEREPKNLDKHLSDYYLTLRENRISITRHPAYEVVMNEWRLSGENNWAMVVTRLKSLGDQEKLIQQITKYNN